MLVLSLRSGDRVRVTLPDGREVWLQAWRKQNQVRLAFEAPRDVEIIREKVLLREEPAPQKGDST
jgi:sRNA-binding carbon storage regulator CsrA